MITGYVLGESLRPGAVFAPHGLRIRKIERVDNSVSSTAGQPDAWTFVEWETDDDGAAGRIAEALADALEPAVGWYADFTVGEERVVVFAGKVFRYRRGDEAGRAEAVAYGRSAGTPEHQLDWDE
ncbi:hypothetical protein R6V09_05175 [Streptomyces sp. W16]|uniref:hypothetical protein n=1 Tax=Streptomyces sp. W16 TaxID=3076631 RepID=UPI00295BD567|nr:hypothetical protein [Streptomyces sp. W16]MDV9169526.1 hypothetical protein [Streptomyces sp. W16]